MKECPYCFKEIQDTAIKCEFCGEWLKSKEVHSDKEVEFVPESSDTSKESNSDRKIYTPLKQKVGWGWGWFILLGFYGTGVQKISYRYPSGATFLIELFGVAFLLLSYFWLRNRIIRKGTYGEKTWMASFIAGFITYLIIGALVGFSLGFIGMAQEKSDIKKFLREFQDRVIQLNQEENKINEAFILTPKSNSDIKNNLKKLDEYLVLINKKFYQLKEFIKFLKELSERRRDKIFSEEVNKLQILIDKNYDITLKSMEALRKYYRTGDENIWLTYEKMSQEKELLGKEIQTMLNNITRKI